MASPSPGRLDILITRAALVRSMEIRVHKPEDLKGSMLLIGFPSRGLVGGVAATFVIDELKMWQIASLQDPRLPPTMVIKDGVGYSPIQFYVSAERCGPDGTCDKLVACISEVPFNPELLGEVAWTIVTWAKKEGVAQIVVLEGVESTTPGGAKGNGKSKAPVIRGVRSISSKHSLTKYKIPKVPEGVVSGYASAFLLAANALDVDLVTLFIEARADLPDAHAAAFLLKVVDPMLPHIDFESKRLEARAVQLETDMKRSIKTTTRQLAAMRRTTDLMYQ